VKKAVIIIIKSGIDANLEKKPSSINTLQIISNVPVREAQNAGWMNPIFENLPAPNNSGKRNF
jgi:hypothetical protein